MPPHWPPARLPPPPPLPGLDVRVALCGSFNAGKTTLVNALLGRDILPTARRETTPCPVEIRSTPLPALAPLPWWGVLLTLGVARLFHRRAEAMREGWVLPPAIESDHGSGWVPRDEAWLDETRVGRADDSLLRIRVTVPGAAHLPEGLVLVDTAGLDGRDEGRDAHTLTAACSADRILFLVLGRKALTRAERGFLARMGPHRARVHLVLGHADLVPEADRRIVEEDLAQVTGDHPDALADGWSWCALPPADDRFPEDRLERERSVQAVVVQLHAAMAPAARRALLALAVAQWEQRATAEVAATWQNRGAELEALVQEETHAWRRSVVATRKHLRKGLRALRVPPPAAPVFDLQDPQGADAGAARAWTGAATEVREAALVEVETRFQATVEALVTSTAALLRGHLASEALPTHSADSLRIPERCVAPLVNTLVEAAAMDLSLDPPGWWQRTFSYADARKALQARALERTGDLRVAIDAVERAAESGVQQARAELEAQALDRYDAAVTALGGPQRIRAALQDALDKGRTLDMRCVRTLVEEMRRARGL